MLSRQIDIWNHFFTSGGKKLDSNDELGCQLLLCVPAQTETYRCHLSPIQINRIEDSKQKIGQPTQQTLESNNINEFSRFDTFSCLHHLPFIEYVEIHMRDNYHWCISAFYRGSLFCSCIVGSQSLIAHQIDSG
mmetsp:Transcript_10952/g.16737  ORF Transcript_10952/g.16737 Transcript_10952/m.16737 type:complete len:134 (-) Transcript_10952:521-922(-)